jgi:hypothetical protein
MTGRGSPLAACLVVLLTAAASCAGPSPGGPASAAAMDPSVSKENGLPGSTGWTLPARGTGISGYAVPASVDVGQEVGIAVSTISPTYDLDVYRIGWYGGSRGRLVSWAHGLPGLDQGTWMPQTFGVSNCRTCLYNQPTGLLEPRWSVTHRLVIPKSWLSGDYLVRLMTPAGDTANAYFVVRDDRYRSQVLAVLPLNTYQAYNNWGGKSLYSSNSVGPATLSSGEFKGAATEVSLERPYASYSGVRQDFEMVAFLERNGYDVTYATSVDLDRDPALLTRHRIFISVGHDEYWSRAMRDHVESARDRGVNLLFLGGNDLFWQVRYRQGAGGTDRSVLVCYRSAGIDPVAASDPAAATVRFADPPLSRPASSLTGTVYTDPILKQPAAWVVAPTAPAWLLAGTSLSPGSSIAGLVGVECDRLDTSQPVPQSLVVVSDSPVTKSGTTLSHCDSVYYRARSGAQVFSAGTWSWEDFLDGPKQNADVVTMTINLMSQFGSSPRSGGAS